LNQIKKILNFEQKTSVWKYLMMYVVIFSPFFLWLDWFFF